MGQLERYGLFVLCLVIVLILGVAIWGGEPVPTTLPQSGSLAAPSTATDWAPPAATDDALRTPLFEPVPPKVTAVDASATAAPPADTELAAFAGGAADPVRAAPGPTSEPAKKVEPPVAGALRTYVVREKDTLETIAKRELGSPRYVAEIRKLNPGVDPRRMQIGTELTLPYDADTAPKLELGSSGWRQYTVKSGDTPWDIAEAMYGNGKYVDRILKANNIRDNLIRPRTVLRIPPLD